MRQAPVRALRTFSRYQKASRLARSTSGEILVLTTNWRVRVGLRAGMKACGSSR